MTNPATPPPAPHGGMPKWLIILIVILLVIILGCCGGFVMCTYVLRKAGEAAPGFIQAQAKERLGMEVDTTGNGLALPKNFPADVPVYSGFKAKSIVAPPGTPGGIVNFEGKEDPQKVSDFYDKELTAKGWTQESSSNNNDSYSSSYKKGDLRVHILTSGTADNCTANISYGQEKAQTPGADQGAQAPTPDENPEKPAPAGATANRTAQDTTPAAPAPNASNLPKSRMPANFPSDVPVQSGFTPNYAVADKVKGSGSVMLTGKADKDKTVSYYETELDKQGWKQEQNTDFGNGTVMVYSKDNRKLNLSIVPDEKGSTLVTISYETQK